MNSWGEDRDGGQSDRVSPMVYDGGLKVSGEPNFVPVLPPELPLCECKPRRWWSLMTLHTDDEACPQCGGAWPEPAVREPRHPWRFLWSVLASPFKREEAEPMELYCVRHEAIRIRDGEGRAELATMIIDGMSVCDGCARPMLKILAERLPARQASD